MLWDEKVLTLPAVPVPAIPGESPPTRPLRSPFRDAMPGGGEQAFIGTNRSRSNPKTNSSAFVAVQFALITEIGFHFAGTRRSDL
jgi:hypothetical protein